MSEAATGTAGTDRRPYRRSKEKQPAFRKTRQGNYKIAPTRHWITSQSGIRIDNRHYGLFASANRAESIATARALLNVAPPAADPQEQPDVAPDSPRVLPCPCPRCGARMIVIETFARGCEPRWRPTPIRIDTS